MTKAPTWPGAQKPTSTSPEGRAPGLSPARRPGSMPAVSESSLRARGAPDQSRLTSMMPTIGDDDIAAAQARRAPRSESRAGKHTAETAELQALAKDLVTRLAMLLKTVRLHSVHNSALQYSVKIFVLAIQALHQRIGEFTLRGDGDSLFVDDMRIRPEPILYDNIVHLLEQWAARDIGGITITRPLDPIAVRSLLAALTEHPSVPTGEGPRTLGAAVEAKGVQGVSFQPRLTLVTDRLAHLSGEEALATHAVHAYTQLFGAWKGYLATREPVVPEVVRTRVLQAVQTMVDVLHDDVAWSLATTTHRDPASPAVNRSVHCCVLSLALGQRVGIGRKALMNLGMSALFADAGLRHVPESDHGRAMDHSARRPAILDIHPLLSVQEVLQTHGLTRAQRDRIVVAYEHHLGHDGSGYPSAISGKTMHLFSRIVALCDRYVELCSDVAGAQAMAPSRALEVLAVEAARFDPRVLRVFIHMLGAFPVGTLIELDTGELAVVLKPSAVPGRPGRPTVRVVSDPFGNPVRPSTLDLGEADDDGTWLCSIRQVHPPSRWPDPIPPLLFGAAREESELAVGAGG